MFKKTNLFTLLTQFAVIILPFYVFVSVFFTNIVWIPKAWFFIKELLLVFILLSLAYQFIKDRKFPKLDIIDYSIILFIIYWVFISFVNWLWINSIIHWWRYDFMFLIVIMIYKNWKHYLKVKTKDLIRIFLYSWASMLLFSFMIKFRLKEEFLIEFWYIDYVSDWIYKWWVPIYHWLENSGIRRFQWILDWPNTMAYFLIIFSWIFLHFQKKKTEFWVISTMIFLFWLIILTYSRSALLWIFSAIWIIFLLNFKYLYKRFKKHIAKIIAWFLLFFWSLWIIFHNQIENIVLRNSSTTWHFDRMAVWIDRFKENIFGQWLAESWPAYRYIYPDKTTKKEEEYYIPESWYIQLMIEGWVIYIWLFFIIIFSLLKRVYKKSRIIFWMFFAVLIMNVFLHTFESTYLSFLISIFIWLFASKR